MSLRRVLIMAGLVAITAAGCASCKKNSEVANDNQATETQQTSDNAIQVEEDMDWKYKHEVLIRDTDADAMDRIEALLDEAQDGRPEIFYQIRVKTEDDVALLDYKLSKFGKKVTTIEVIYDESLGKLPTRLFLPDKVDTRLIVTGGGDKPLAINAETLEISADTVIVRNMAFDHQEYRGALKLDVGRLFVGADLSFSNNKFERHEAHLAKPLIEINSHARDGEFSRYVLKNVTFAENQSEALLRIGDDSRQKFESIELDHVVARNNTNLSMGIDISATKEVLVHDSELTGSTAAPLLFQIPPEPQVTLRKCKVSDRVYGYRPLKENWHTDAKPVIKEDIEEAEGTVFDKVP